MECGLFVRLFVFLSRFSTFNVVVIFVHWKATPQNTEYFRKCGVMISLSFYLGKSNIAGTEEGRTNIP